MSFFTEADFKPWSWDENNGTANYPTPRECADRANAKRDAEMVRMASALRDLKDHSVKQQGEIERLQAENAQLFERWQAKFPELVSVKKERDELRADNARLREALEKIAKVHGSGDKVVCLHAIDFCAKTSRAALEGM